MGGALCPSIITGVLSGCGPAYRPDYQLKTLTAVQNQMVTTLTELIIPATDTPGAKAAKVNQFIDLMLTRYFQDDEKEEFLTGLDLLDKKSQELFGSFFAEIPDENQVELLKKMEEGSLTSQQNDDRDESFFELLKELTITGYYTSEIGASQELIYLHTAGRYDGDVPYSEIGRAYS